MHSDGTFAVIAKWYERLLQVLVGAAVLCIVAIMLTMLYDIVLRTMSITPSPWLSVVPKFALLYFTMLMAPYLAGKKAHVCVEILVSHLPPVTKKVVTAITWIVCIFICLVMVFYAAKIAGEAYVRGDQMVLEVPLPLWLIYVPLPIGFGLMAVEFGRHLLNVGATEDAASPVPGDSA